MNPISSLSPISSPAIAFGINISDDNDSGNKRGRTPVNNRPGFQISQIKVLKPKPSRSWVKKLKLTAIALGILQPAVIYSNFGPTLKTSRVSQVTCLASNGIGFASLLWGGTTLSSWLKRRKDK